MVKTAQIGATVSNMVENAPLPKIVEGLGVSVANAQFAMDQNSIAMAQSMATTQVQIGDKSLSLLALGFMPTFYAFTEAEVKAKLAFSMKKEVSFSGKAQVAATIGVVAASVEASYSQKFSMSAEGSSAISARIVSLPAPTVFQDILRAEFLPDEA